MGKIQIWKIWRENKCFFRPARTRCVGSRIPKDISIYTGGSNRGKWNRPSRHAARADSRGDMWGAEPMERKPSALQSPVSHLAVFGGRGAGILSAPATAGVK